MGRKRASRDRGICAGSVSGVNRARCGEAARA